MSERLNPEQQERVDELKFYIQHKRDLELAIEVTENNIAYLSHLVTRFFIEVDDGD